MNKHKYIQSLEETIIQITAERDAALKRVQELEREKEEIMSKLRIYENAHTPPSMQIVRKKKRPPKKGRFTQKTWCSQRT